MPEPCSQNRSHLTPQASHPAAPRAIADGDALDRLLHLTTQALRVPIAWITLAAEGQYHLAASTGLPTEQYDLLLSGRPWIDQVTQTRQPLVIEDTHQPPTGESEEAAPKPTSPELRAVLLYPITNDYDEVRGILGVGDPSPRTWSPAEQQILEHTAQLVRTLINSQHPETAGHEDPTSDSPTGDSDVLPEPSSQSSNPAPLTLEQQFISFMQHWPGFSWIKDSHGRYVYVNDSILRELQISPDDILDHTAHEIFPRAIADQLTQHDAQVLGTGETLQTVDEILIGNEPRLHLNVRFLLSGTQTPRQSGGPVMLAGVGLNVTHWTRAVSELRQVLSSARCLLWHGETHREDGEIHYTLEVWNDEAAQRFLPFNVPAGGTYSESWQTSIPAEDRENIRRKLAEYLRDEPTHFTHEYRCLTSDGSVRWLREEVRAEPSGPNRWKIVGVGLDITERKLAEERTAMFQVLGERLNRADTPEAAARTAFEVAETLFGWDACWLQLCDLNRPHRTRIIALTDTIDGVRVDVPTEPEHAEPSPLAQLAIRTGPRVFSGTNPPLPTVNAYGDKSRASASIMVVPIRLAEQTIGAMSIQSYQPNAYTEADLRVFQAMADYCAGALARTQARDARRALEEHLREAQRMDAIGKLAGGVAHDFNNMLAVINGYSELLLTSIPHDHPWHEGIAEIRTAGERAARLTRQLLAFGRKQLLELRALDFHDVLTGLEHMLRQLVGEHVELILAPEADLWPVHADMGQLEQVIVNLALTARDAMPNGGQLRITARNLSFDGNSPNFPPKLPPGEYVAFQISDTGHGIDPGILPYIFEPFFTTKPTGQGTGLGLATVYGIIQQCDGGISVDSVPGQGTTFTLYLPRAASEARRAEVPQASLPPLATTSTETILLVEDEPMVRTMVRQALEMFGFRVLTAAGPTEAIRISQEHPEHIDLLLTDVIMPQMHGVDLAREVLERHPHTQVAYMSGYSNDVIGRHGLLDGQTVFIQKPFTPLHLAQRIREVLDQRRAGTASRGRILIVDDDPNGRESLCEVLTDAGYEVILAANGAEGLALLQSQPQPDLILLDLMMPGMNGWVFSLELQKHPHLADIPIVLVSGAYDTGPAAGFLNAAGHLTKPIDIEQLLTLAERFCSVQSSGQDYSKPA